jgi:GT2 family glycosyltransferase
VGTRNSLEHLKQCINSVVQETTIPYKLYVIDAGSSDGTVEYLDAIKSDRIIPVFQGNAVGQAAAYNKVFNAIESPYSAWISDDNVIINRGLDAAVAILRRDPLIGMVGLKVRDLLGPFADAPYVGGISSVGILNVNQGVLPTPVLKAVGGFSEDYKDYGIDPDLTAKVLIAGHDVVMTKAVAILHYRQWTTDKNSDEYIQRKNKQKIALEIYEQKYKGLEYLSWPSRVKNDCWMSVRRSLKRRINLNSHQRVLGLLPRDWSNLLGGRFISILDPVRYWNSNYHFRQRLPRQLAASGKLDVDKRRLSKDGS